MTLTVGCGVGSIHEVYGGCNLADIKGNVTLNLFGGTINGEAFGGSNRNGNITGMITVNMIDQKVQNCGLTVHNIYGAGNLTAYDPNGDVVVSPVVNLIHGTVSKSSTTATDGNVFGGAKGTATYPPTVTASPKVNIGYVDEIALPQDITVSESQVNVKGNVYGGGNLAPVAQGTSVTMQRKETTNSYTSMVDGSLFGGGKEAAVTGATAVTINDGTVGVDVYGGGELATTGSSLVTLNNGTVTRDIYGGGLGADGLPANIGETQVVINGGTVRDVYGCNNVNGAPTIRATVTFGQSSTGSARNVYGGGNQASTGETVPVTVNFNLGSADTVFGGGQSASVGYSTVNIAGGAIAKGVYGGSMI